MPVTKDELDQGRTRDTLEFQILTFLESYPDQAFTAVEVADALNRLPKKRNREKLGAILKEAVADAITVLPVQRALDNLVEEDQVRKEKVEKNIGESDYYIIQK